MLFGALLQLLLCAALPMRWAVVPPCVMLIHSIALTVIQTLSDDKNTFMHGVVPGRTTAQVPSPVDGSFGSRPGAQPVVVFNLGVQYNHPLGMLAPEVKQMGEYFEAMRADLHERRHDLGLLDMSFWRGADRDSNSTMLMTMFFRDLEGLHRFAHEPIHREAWDWWHAKARNPKHIGIFHETFCVPAGAYETLYVNCRPVLMGRGQVRTGEEGKDQVWRSTLVGADNVLLKTQYSRMDRDENGVPKG